MTDSPSDRQPPPEPAGEVSVRASDADRDEVAEILREALVEGRLDAAEHAERLDTVYAARTVAELEPVTRDLPGPRAGDRAERPTGTVVDGGAVVRSGAKENLVAVFSTATRKGRWQVPGRINVTAVFGNVEIDLRGGVFTQPDVQINVTAVFGSVVFKVPENISVRQQGVGVFGAFEAPSLESEDPAAPSVLVKGAAVFGSVELKPRPFRRRPRGGDRRERFRKEL